MPETRIISVRHAPEGWQDDPNYVYIGRAVPRKGLKASQWANLFHVSDHGRAEAIRLYENYVRDAINHGREAGDGDVDRDLRALHSKTLVCWCAPKGGVTRLDRPWCCHGQVLAQLAHELQEVQPSS